MDHLMIRISGLKVEILKVLFCLFYETGTFGCRRWVEQGFIISLLSQYTVIMTFNLRRKRKSNNQNLIKLINITFFRRGGKLSIPT